LGEGNKGITNLFAVEPKKIIFGILNKYFN
jgi:hypothetical protein